MRRISGRPVTITTGTSKRSSIDRAQARTEATSGAVTTSVTTTSSAGTKGIGSGSTLSATP
ncbi:MAG: hypothetical protein E6H84_07415 [Chloroflexi bacterium]|nr:MAG: hypothetical protein E6H84_07415 [Chloroflexota bacterium]